MPGFCIKTMVGCEVGGLVPFDKKLNPCLVDMMVDLIPILFDVHGFQDSICVMLVSPMSFCHCSC